MNYLSFVTNIARYKHLKSQKSNLEQKENKTEEEINALKSLDKGLKIGMPISAFIIIIFCISLLCGLSYVDFHLPKNSNKTTCWTDSDGVVYTSHLSLKGMSLEELGMTDPNYKIGTTFEVYLDRDTDLPIYAITTEKLAEMENIAIKIVISGLIFLIVSVIIFVIIMRKFVTKPWIQYAKKYNIC